MANRKLQKSSSCQVYKLVSSSSDTSTNSWSENSNSDSPLKRFNRILRSSVARHWAYFKKSQPSLRHRGRSVSDTGLSSIIDHDSQLAYLDIPLPPSRHSIQVIDGSRKINRSDVLKRHFGFYEAPNLNSTSAGGGSNVGIEEASDGSDAERQRKSHHLRVPTPAFVGQSTGNFAAGAAGGGCGVPRSAPATPLQLEPQPPRAKHDKQAIKPLSGSAPSVRVSTVGPGTEEKKEGKQPSKARQKKFQRHFPQVGPEERVLNYYSCALVGDLLLQGHLYITKNYFAFYSNVFGYVTKLLIPTTSVLRITKEKVARIIPNAVGVCTRDERHVFGSLLSRDSTYKLMTHVWKSARAPELVLPNKTQVSNRHNAHARNEFGSLLSSDSTYKLMIHAWKSARAPEHVLPNKTQDLRASEVELDASEYSPEDDSSSAGGDRLDAPEPPARRESEAIITSGSGAVIQPALLTGSASRADPRRDGRWTPALAALVALAALLLLSAGCLAYRLYVERTQPPEDLLKLSGEELYNELVRWRARLHGRAATELHSFLSTNLLLLTKVRQSLEALSGVILTDMAANAGQANVNVPADPVFS